MRELRSQPLVTGTRLRGRDPYPYQPINDNVIMGPLSTPGLWSGFGSNDDVCLLLCIFLIHLRDGIPQRLNQYSFDAR